MKLIAHELKADPLAQTLVCPKNMSLYAIRPHLYKHNTPTGTLKLEVYNGSDVLIATSETLDIADISDADFFHGYVRFIFSEGGLQKDATYTIKLVGGGGYTFNESAYVGWCNGFDLGKYDPSYSPLGYLNYPMDLEIWQRKAV